MDDPTAVLRSSAQTFPTCSIVPGASGRNSAFEADDGLRVSLPDGVDEAHLERQRRVSGRVMAVRHRRVKSMVAWSRKL